MKGVITYYFVEFGDRGRPEAENTSRWIAKGRPVGTVAPTSYPVPDPVMSRHGIHGISKAPALGLVLHPKPQGSTCKGRSISM